MICVWSGHVLLCCFVPVALKFTCFKSFALSSLNSWLTWPHLAFSATSAAQPPPLHVTKISATLNPVILVGLGGPLLHRNRRTQRKWRPEKFYQKPAHPGGRSCCSSPKYTYTACPILYSSHVCLCHCSCTSVLSSTLQRLTHFYLNLGHCLIFPRLYNPLNSLLKCLRPQ